MNRLLFISIILLSLFALSLSSCSVADENFDDSPDVGLLAVFGKVTDKASSEPIDSVMLILSSFNSSDFSARLSTDTTLTDAAGKYKFLNAPYSLANSYVIEAIEACKKRKGGKYSSGRIEIFLSADSPLYDSDRKFYFIGDQNFFLTWTGL